MKFVLSFLLVFLCVFATAQVPPMVLGGPQGISSKRVLAEQWLSIPVMVDTPAAPLTGAPWPEKGYIVHVTKANDTTVWHYTGKRWQRIGGTAENRYTELIGGGKFSRNASLNRFTVGSSTYYIEGQYYSSASTQLNGFSKTPNSNGRIDIVALGTTGPVIIQGTESANPISPIVAANRIKLGFVYYPPFDTLPTISGNGIEAIFRRPGVDSIFFSTSDTTLSIKDSIGVSSGINGLTATDKNVKLGGSLIENTSVNLNTRRLNIIGGSDTTRFFSNGRVSIGGTPDSANVFNVNGNSRINGVLSLAPASPSNSAVIINQNSSNGNLAFGGSQLNLNASIGIRNVILSTNGSYANLIGDENIFVGASAGSSISTGDGNIFIGDNSGLSSTTSNYNTAVGYGSMYANTSGSNNVASGRSTLFFNTVGYSNVAIGSRTMRNNTTGSNTVAVGDSALINNNASGIVAVGSKSLFNNISGFGNTAIGFRTLYSNTAGNNNTALGDSSGYSNTGSGNIFVGKRAGLFITTGSQNTIIGSSSLSGLSSSTSNSIHLIASSFPSGVVDTPLLGLSSRYAFIGGGASSTYINDYYFGGGSRVQFANDANVSFFAPSGWPSKADTIGSNFTINAGRGTGQGLGGSVIFRTSDTTTAGTTLQTLTERARVTPKGNLLVGTSTDNSSAIVNISSTTKGFLPPRMTGAQAELIGSPAEGLMIYSTDGSGATITSKGWWGYDGSTWVKLN